MFRSPARARTMLHVRRLCESLEALGRDRRGTSAIEFAFFASFLSVALLNVADISIYVFERMQVENATQMGAQAAWKACDTTQLPATTNCPGLATAVTHSVQSTSLGSRVKLQSNSPSEGYYCVNSSGVLQYVSDVNSKPADCSAAGNPGLNPGDYIKVQTTFSYAPLFPGLTVGRLFATPITRTTIMRLG
jgi:Flp pilus assembly protein TadG